MQGHLSAYLEHGEEEPVPQNWLDILSTGNNGPSQMWNRTAGYLSDIRTRERWTHKLQSQGGGGTGIFHMTSVFFFQSLLPYMVCFDHVHMLFFLLSNSGLSRTFRDWRIRLFVRPSALVSKCN
jgi:hypothetical protein